MSVHEAPAACYDSPICALVAATRHGDQQAFGQLVEMHRGMVYSTAFHALRHREAAEDASQEVFIQAYLKIGDLKDASHFSGWLQRIARNTALNKRRSKRWEISGTVIPEKLANDKSPVMRLLDEEKKEGVQQAIGRLSEQHREVLTLHYLDGLKTSEIGLQLGIKQGTVKSRLFAARECLEKELQTMGFAVKERESTSPSYEGRTSAARGSICASRSGDSVWRTSMEAGRQREEPVNDRMICA